MRDVEEIIKALTRPPSVANWVRHNYRRSDRTRKGLLRFALSPPPYSLSEVYAVCSAVVTDGISLEQAEKCLETIKDRRVRLAGKEILPAFYEFSKEHRLAGLSAFKGFSTPYPIGRSDGATLSIPVVPTFTMLNGKTLVPVFLIGWARMSLDDYQKRLLSTIIYDAILTQQDFMGSDALIICTPRHRRTRTRHILTWRSHDYADLSEEELQEQFARYRQALEDLIRALRAK